MNAASVRKKYERKYKTVTLDQLKAALQPDWELPGDTPVLYFKIALSSPDSVKEMESIRKDGR